MRKNQIFKKLKKVLAVTSAVAIAVTSMVASNLTTPAQAQTTATLTVGSASGTSYQATGKSYNNGYTSCYGSMGVLAVDGHYAYCTDPFMTATAGTVTQSNLAGYASVTQLDVNVLGATFAYIDSNYSGNYSVKQFAVWNYLSGKANYVATFSGVSSDIVSKANTAIAWGKANTSKYTGIGYVYTNSGQPVITVGYQLSTGSITITKSSANIALTNNCNAYTLAGAEYGLYSGSTKIATLTTNASGTATATGIKAGTYTLKEIKAPNGYALNSGLATVTVTAGTTTSYTASNCSILSDKPQNDPVSILLQKVDKENGIG